ncbi:sensor histidine kinase [Roseateles paludis]|jgi:PAS domain S-box-containing protein|uniref:PAS domain-containing protein n=1 Tax=Roseateles paludis TaxID=3145238 RepID=A0ABV0FZ66_9BURK
MPLDAADAHSLMLASIGEGIFGIDLDGRCTFVNPAALQLLGHRTETVLGRNMHDLVHHTHADGQHYPECDCPIFKAFRLGQPCRIDDEVLWRADGTPFQAEYASHPLLEQGRVVGAVVSFVDIGERKRGETLLRRANDVLEARVAARTGELNDALTRLRDLAQHLEGVREAERTRIAREIHDELGSLLVALKLDTGWLARRLPADETLHGKLQAMGRTIDTAVDNLGRIITDLRPSILDHQGLWAALEWQAQEFIETTELAADLQVHVAAGVVPPQGGLAIAVFRIFQEILSNVARHARAQHVWIRIAVDDPPEPTLYLEVRDDGIGARPDQLSAPRSYGVMGMHERAAPFGGRVSIETAPGQGMRVRLVMPLGGAS